MRLLDYAHIFQNFILLYSFIGNENAADENKETSTFRRALPQFLAVGVKNMILFGKYSFKIRPKKKSAQNNNEMFGNV